MLFRSCNDFRLARIEREKLERAQKHAERAAANKNEASAKADADEAPPSATPSDSPVLDKQAAIAAAIERAKAAKLAAAQAGLAPKNTENVSPSVQAEIKQTDAIREKARKLTESGTSVPDKG